MAITTNIYGYLYKSDGTKITTGNIIVSLSQDFTSIDGNKVAPFITTQSLSAEGLIDFDLFATVNNVSGSSYGAPYPTGVAYMFEFDPEPTNLSVALIRKNGYWRAQFIIPHISDTVASNQVGIGSLVPALSSAITYNPSYVSVTDPNLLTAEQKALLTDGISSNADDLHSHGAVSNTLVSLTKITSIPAPLTDYAYIYMTTTGTSPNKEIRVIGLLENGTEFLLASVVV